MHERCFSGTVVYSDWLTVGVCFTGRKLLCVNPRLMRSIYSNNLICLISIRSKATICLWLVNEMRAYSWIFKLYWAMDSYRHGYTISRQFQFRIKHASESHCKRFPGLSPQMQRMVGDVINLLGVLDQQVLSRYDDLRTIQLTGKEDRRSWEEIHQRLKAIAYEKPCPECCAGRETNAPFVTVKSLWE